MYYAGFGLLRDRNFLEVLFGRKLRADETEEVIYGFKLKVLQKEELPLKIQGQTDEGFKIYALVPDLVERGRVKVVMLGLSRSERRAVRALNFGDELFKPDVANINHKIAVSEIKPEWEGVGLRLKGLAEADVLKDPTLGQFVDGMTYDPFLNEREAAMETARQLHNAFVRPHLEGNPRMKER